MNISHENTSTVSENGIHSLIFNKIRETCHTRKNIFPYYLVIIKYYNIYNYDGNINILKNIRCKLPYLRRGKKKTTIRFY